ncbi:RICIN domain-containing protein [Streptomyces sp. NPDC047315]|uniref:RICIN domain-containing protein n=1 Tax=Streptomyces sp. NPDC047315 TaxID=3155142 RepID=UPI003406C3BA
MGGQGLPERDWIGDVLRQVLGGGELSARQQARVDGNRARQHMAAVTLNALARFGQGAELTDLEQKAVESFRRAGVSDEKIAEYGQIFTEASPEAKARAFPDSVAGLTPETAYGWDDFRRDAPQAVKDVLDLPQVRVVELAPGQDSVEAPPADGAAAEAAEAAGWSLTVVHAPQSPSPAPPPAAAPANPAQFVLWADNFYCEKESNDGGASDELYFGFVASDGRTSTHYMSPVIEGVDAGETHAIPGVTLWDGPATKAGLTVLVEVYEEDAGDDYDKVAAAIANAAQTAVRPALDEDLIDSVVAVVETTASVLNIDIAAPVITGAVVSFALGIEFILKWAPDDHVGSHTFTFTPAALLALGSGLSPTTYEAVIDEHRQEARIRLRLKGYRRTARKVRLISAKTGQAASVHHGSTESGVYVEQWPYLGGTNQNWELWQNDDGTYVLISERSHQALTVHDGSTAQQASIVQWPYQNATNQHWRLTPTTTGHMLTNVRSGQVLSVNDNSTAQGEGLIQWPDEGALHQRWRIEDL